MNRPLLLSCSVAVAVASSAQDILLVNDNDYITYNTDTIISDLTAAGLSFDVWSIPDSGGAYPTNAFMDAYDHVIWYASTDGVGLGFWDSGAQSELIDRVFTGKHLWVIGQDLLYAQYGSAPVTFVNGDFAYDFMGLTSYDVQSYADDGALGCTAVYVDAGVQGAFDDSLAWIFTTNWYMDGVSMAPMSTPIYAMGPGSYALDGAVSMFHFAPSGFSIMSTFFDPALINTFEARVAFLSQTIQYMDEGMGIAAHSDIAPLQIGNNPTTDIITIRTDIPFERVQALDAQGRIVMDLGTAQAMPFEVDLSSLQAGTYTVRTLGIHGVRTGRAIKL
ncbi:MAG: T9SS type A sorting domain-containing protein [Flavobacteriales bacterium]|nr:MAG: T9SS type A sorting domain-containing protein [Flavobacteriales bacterium]